MSDRVDLIDVSLRDGFQDEPVFVATAEKAAVAASLQHAGVRTIEATSFVHPRWVPQLADAEALVPMLPRGPRYSALVMNVRGVERAHLAFGAAGFASDGYDVVYVTSASPRHAMANNNRTIGETLAIFDDVARAVREHAMSLRAAIACSFVSPWDDEPIDGGLVGAMAEHMATGGATIVTLADTVGRADPRTVAHRIAGVARALDVPLSAHLHDSFGYGLACVYAALEGGVRIFEGALAGLGGCPFAPGAPGNLDLEKLARFLAACGAETGIDGDALREAAARTSEALAAATPLEPSTRPAGASAVDQRAASPLK